MTVETNNPSQSRDSGTGAERISLRLSRVEAEHGRITVMLEKATQAFARHCTPPEVNSILLELNGYTVTHFREEEELMRVSEFPGFEVHKQEHDRIAGYIRGLLNMRSKQDAMQGALNALNLWSDSHIRITDKKFLDFVHHKEK
jgi:hemerythrin